MFGKWGCWNRRLGMELFKNKFLLEFVKCFVLYFDCYVDGFDDKLFEVEILVSLVDLEFK